MMIAARAMSTTLDQFKHMLVGKGEEKNSEILAGSTFLTTTMMTGMKNTTVDLKLAGLRNEVKIIVYVTPLHWHLRRRSRPTAPLIMP